MLPNIDQALQFQTEALKVRGFRTEVLAANVANADTPGYKARDLDFAQAMQLAGANLQPVNMERTNAAHQTGSRSNPFASALMYRSASQPSLDGNTVDRDVERAAFAENALRYEASFTFLNGQLRTLLTAIQG